MIIYRGVMIYGVKYTSPGYLYRFRNETCLNVP